MKRFQILSLSGGGFRGLYTASVLTHLEEHFGRPISECFDLICGTSVGGIITTGLAYGVNAREIQESLLNNRANIFSKTLISKLSKGFLAPLYDNKVLRSTIERLLPDNSIIANAKTPYLTSAVNLHSGLPRVFKTPHHKDYVVDGALSPIEAALATSAAPFYFPPVKVGADYYVDGGLFANAPDLLGLHEAEHYLQVPKEKIFMLSIGTTGKISGLGHRNTNSWGAWDWIKKDRLIVEMTFSAQQAFATNIVGRDLKGRYIRIDETHSGDSSFSMDMDDISQSAVDNMESLSSRSFMRSVNSDDLKQFFEHTVNRDGLTYNFRLNERAA